MMDDAKFKELMDTIKASWEELKSDFSFQISKLQQDVQSREPAPFFLIYSDGEKRVWCNSVTLFVLPNPQILGIVYWCG